MVHKIKKPKFNTLLVTHVFTSSDHLGGVLSQLRNKTSSLDEYLNLFIATESSHREGIPQNVFNYDTDTKWWTDLNQNDIQWIQIEMKNIYLTISGYILMSPDACCSYPKSWYLEGKNNGTEEWRRIDERSNETDLKGVKLTKSFKNNKLRS